MKTYSAWQFNIARYKLKRRATRSQSVFVVNEFRVRCSGKLHRIAVLSNDKIVIRDHSRDELKAMRLFKTLGDNQCKCLDVLDGFRAMHSFPKQLDVLHKVRQDIHHWRSAMRQWRVISTLQPVPRGANMATAKRRLSGRISDEFKRALKSGVLVYPGCSKTSDSAFGEYSVNCTIGITKRTDPGATYISGAGHYHQAHRAKRSAQWKPSFEMTFVVPLDWFNTVASKGFAIVDNMLCSYARVREDGLYNVVLGRLEIDRETAFKPVVREWEAVASLGSDGALHVVRWDRPCDPVEDDGAQVASYISPTFTVLQASPDYDLKPARMRMYSSDCNALFAGAKKP